MTKFLIILLSFLFFTVITVPVHSANNICYLNGQAIRDCGSGKVCVLHADDTTECLNPSDSSNPITEVFGKINPPDAVKDLGTGSAGISNVLNKFITLIYIGASIITVFFVIISALQWIMSGGDKEAVGKARSRLTYAIIGIVILSLAFVGIKLVGQITGFTFFEGQNNPPPPEIPPITCNPPQQAEWDNIAGKWNCS